MDFSKFLQFPGVLVLAGVLLLIVALVISISSGLKKKKGNSNINQPATYGNPGDVQQPNMGNSMGQPIMNGPGPIANNTPMGNPMEMNNNPMGMPTVDGVDSNVNTQPGFIEPTVPPVMGNNNLMNNSMEMNNNPMGMPTVEPTPVVEPQPAVDVVPPIQPTVETPVVEEKKEPLTNPWANATTAYGGANPMDGVNLNFNQGPQEPYGEKNFVASETPTINAMPKEEAVVMPTINTEAPKTGDDVETL